MELLMYAKWHNSQPWIRGIGCRVPVVTCNKWLPMIFGINMDEPTSTNYWRSERVPRFNIFQLFPDDFKSIYQFPEQPEQNQLANFNRSHDSATSNPEEEWFIMTGPPTSAAVEHVLPWWMCTPQQFVAVQACQAGHQRVSLMPLMWLDFPQWSCKTENAICRDMSWSCILPYSLVWSCLLPLLSLVHLWSSWKLLNAKSGLFRQDSWVSYKTRPSGNETYRIQRTWIGLKSPELRFCPIKWMHRIHSTQPRSSWMVLEWRLKSLLNQRTPLRYGGALVQGLENHQCNQGRCSASTQEEHYFQIQAPPVQYTSSAAWRNNLTLELKYIFTYTDTYMWGLK